MRVQTVVQHHPSRAHLLPSLLAALPAGTQIVTDPEPANRSPWATYLQCLRSLEDDATHLCLIQDDAQPCRDFAKAVALLAQNRPSDPLVLFAPGLGQQRRRILAACQAGERYADLTIPNSFIPAVCVLWPRWAVDSILRYENEHPFGPDRSKADDGALGKWAAATGARIMATVPSLVEHPDMERSLVGRLAMGGKNPARTAACWIGPDLDPLELDW